MKINEIVKESRLSEGPYNASGTLPALAQGIKTGLTGLGGAIKGMAQGVGAKAGAQSAIAGKQQADKVTAVTNQALAGWNQVAQAMKGANQEITPQAATQWFTKFMGMAPSGNFDVNNPKSMQTWIQQNVNAYLAKKAGVEAGAPAQPQDATPPAAGGVQPAGGQAPAGPQAQAQAVQADKASKVGTGQINKIIPTLRTRDLQSVKKTVDAALAVKAKQPAAAPAAAPASPAQGTTAE